jgi:clan AA aspartic protease
MRVLFTDIILENIILENETDGILAADGLKSKDAIRRVNVSALVDTGSWELVINEEIRQKLGLHKAYDTVLDIAGGNRVPCYVTEAVIVRWKDRQAAVNAWVLPNEDPVLLGAMPLEALDLTINPKREVVGKHGDKIFAFAY